MWTTGCRAVWASYQGDSASEPGKIAAPASQCWPNPQQSGYGSATTIASKAESGNTNKSIASSKAHQG